MAIRRFTIREQKIVLIFLLAIIGNGSYYGLIRPLNEKIASLDTEIAKKKKKLKNNLGVIKKSQGVDKEYATLIEQFQQTKSNEQVMSAIIAEIEGVAGELQLQISDLKPKRVKREDTNNRFSVSLDIDSQFVDIIQFLHKLQSQPHYFAVEEAHFDNSFRGKNTSMKIQLVLSKVLIQE